MAGLSSGIRVNLPLMDHWLDFSLRQFGQNHPELREELVSRLTAAWFPENSEQHVWKTIGTVTKVILWSGEYLRSNIALAWVKEKLGLGPNFYWIERIPSMKFADKVFDLSEELPHWKFCIVPRNPGPLRGKFRHQKRAIARRIYYRRIPLRELPPSCPHCRRRWCEGINGSCR